MNEQYSRMFASIDELDKLYENLINEKGRNDLRGHLAIVYSLNMAYNKAINRAMEVKE